MFGRWLKRGGSPDGNINDRYPASSHLIELCDVIKTYESAAGKFTALKNIDLAIDRGEFAAVIGKSGSGKSTLINMITGIDRPTSGTVLVNNTPIQTMTEGQLAVWRGRTIGIVFQFFQLLPTLTVIENVMLPMDFCHMYTPRERHDRALQLLEQVELAEHANKLPAALSGGQQQRVAIARALANDPPLIVADEPTGNLDSRTADSVFRLFERLVDEGKTIVMVTHDNDLAKRVTRTVIIADGEIIDEYLAKALPVLTEDEMIEFTRELERLTFAPGATIIREGELPKNFYIITRGRVDVMLREPSGQEIVVTTMGPGQYFGEIELLRGGTSIATIRASPTSGVEVVALDPNEFKQLITGSETAKAEIAHVVEERIQENAEARQVEEGAIHA